MLTYSKRKGVKGVGRDGTVKPHTYPPSILVPQSLEPSILMAQSGVETPKKVIPIDLSLFQKSLIFPYFMANQTPCCLLDIEQLCFSIIFLWYPASTS